MGRIAGGRRERGRELWMVGEIKKGMRGRVRVEIDLGWAGRG